MFNNFFSKIVPFIRKWGKIILQPDKPQKEIRPMRTACCIHEATKNPLRICNHYFYFHAAIVSRKLSNVNIIRTLSLLLDFNFVDLRHQIVLELSSLAEETLPKKYFLKLRVTLGSTIKYVDLCNAFLISL